MRDSRTHHYGIMSKVTKAKPQRAESQTTLTYSLPIEQKEYLRSVAVASDRDLSQLLRYAVEFQRRRKWRDIPEVAPYA